MNDKLWTPSEIYLLINLVRERPDLYDQSRPGYSNINITEQCWMQIVQFFKSKEVRQCKSKWQILRGTFRSKRHDIRGVSGSEYKTSRKWSYSESMSFILPYLIERQTDTPEVILPLEEIKVEPELKDDIFFEEEESSLSTPTSPPPRKTGRNSEKSVGSSENAFIAYLENKKKSSTMSFLASLEEDLNKLSPSGQRRTKIKILQLISDKLDEENVE